MQIKDGVSWTALEYFKWLQGPDGATAKGGDPVIVPASLVYTDKARYRSSVVVECVIKPYLVCVTNIYAGRYGKPISLAEYAQQFLSPEEGAARTAVKSLTKEIGTKLVQMTVNAPNW